MKYLFTIFFSASLLILHAQPGTIDKTYGVNGNVSVYNKLYTSAAAVQADDKLLLGGYDSTQGQDHRFLLTRHNKDGSMDHSFGIEGTATITVDDLQKDVKASLGWTDIALQPDGKIVAAGNVGWNNDFFPYPPVQYDIDIVVARFLPDGTLDETFGTGGRVVTNFDFMENITGVAIQSDGKIVVGGDQTIDQFGNSNGFLLARYNKNGTLDSSFGNNEGYAIYYERGSYAKDLLLQPDGKIVMGGEQLPDEFIVTRYLPNGLLDESFGNGGRVLTRFPNARSGVSITSITLDEKGRIAVTGNLNYNQAVEIVRYLPNGSLDNSFDEDGKLELPTNGLSFTGIQSNSILAQPGNKLVVTSLASGLILTGLNENGSLDASFGTDKGQTAVTDNIGYNIEYLKAVMQPDGRIVVAGTSFKFVSNNVYTNTYYLNRFNGYPTKVPLAIRIKRWLQNHTLSWKGLPAEDKISYYTVEQSANGTSGFSPVAKVSGAANLKDYSITNSHLLQGNNYYRIKAVSTDGVVRYSEVVSADNTANTASVYPNPAKNYVTVQGLAANETANISIKDGSGNVLARGVSTGSAQYRSQLGNNMQPGTYYVNITTGSKTEVLKFVKE